ncbi:hypothetical protein N9M27_04945 [Flavobacteriales bacterium]|nr:hypothetical protein [Flavobacteriales bacterium]
MKKEKYISDRISFLDHGSNTTIVISTAIDRWKESLLLFWILCWTASGCYLLYELFAGNNEQEMQIGLFIFISFWFYFEYRIARVFLWRKWGMEMISVDEVELSYKRAIGNYGKSNRYYFDQMGPFEVRKPSAKSLTVNIEDSFWFLGGERVQFSYQSKVISFGRQLSFEDANKLVKLLKKQEVLHQKRIEQTSLKSEKQLNSDV